MVPSTEGWAREALDDEACVFVSMSELALLDWLLVRHPKWRNNIMSQQGADKHTKGTVNIG
jgi:hypothetical protein